MPLPHSTMPHVNKRASNATKNAQKKWACGLQLELPVPQPPRSLQQPIAASAGDSDKYIFMSAQPSSFSQDGYGLVSGTFSLNDKGKTPDFPLGLNDVPKRS